MYMRASNKVHESLSFLKNYLSVSRPPQNKLRYMYVSLFSFRPFVFVRPRAP